MEPPEAGQLLASRQERRRLLTRSEPPETFFIIDEGALHRSVGGAAVFREQLDHLVALSRQPNVTIQVLRFDAGGHISLNGPFILLEFPTDDDPDVLFIENALGESLFIDDAARTSSYRLRFWELEDQATQPDAFEEFVRSRRDDLM